MNLPLVRTRIRLTTIEASGGYVSDWPHPPYLWTVFFKVDGTTVSVTGLSLTGNATVVGTPGDQGDLGAAAETGFGPVWQVPASPGDFLTTVVPISAPASLGGPFAGQVGCLVILINQYDTPSSAVAAGHTALNTAVQQAIDGLIAQFGPQKTTITQADITGLAGQVQSAVVNAVTNSLSTWQKIILATNDGPDEPLQQQVYLFDQEKDLMPSPPAGISMNKTYNFGGFIGKTGIAALTVVFKGTVVADPYPLSLKRIGTGIGFPPPFTLGPIMGGNQSIKDWIASVR